MASTIDASAAESVKERSRPALLLDRDGVINVERPYICSVADFEFIEGIFDLCRDAVDLGMALVVVTNQAGIGRGLYTEGQFWSLTDWMREQFLERGITIDGVYFCPHHPEHGIGAFRRDCYDRKPNPGMILRAREDMDLDLRPSVFIGDKNSDIEAARAAGVGRTVLLCNGVPIDGPIRCAPDIQIASLREASRCLFGHLSQPDDAVR